MIQFREIVFTAKHLKKKKKHFSRECLLFAYFSILYFEKICISCAKYVLLNNILLAKKSLCVSKKKIPKLSFFLDYATAPNLLNNIFFINTGDKDFENKNE